MPTDIGTRLARLEKLLRTAIRSPKLANASLENGAVDVYDENGSLRAVIGQQADGTSGIVHVNGPPPPTPTTPALTAVLGGVAVTWDGRFVGDDVAPLDFSRIEVHSSPTADFEPTQETQVGTIESPRGGTVPIPAEEPVHVRLLARNLSGTASAQPSGTAGPTGPAVVVAQDVLDGIITETKIAQQAITEAKIALGAVTETKVAAGAVTTDKLTALSVTAEKIATLAVTTDKLAALSVTADQLAANAVTATKIKAGVIEATHIKAGSITAEKLDANAINGKTITGATIQTAPDGPRLVLSASRLRAIGSNGSSIGMEPNAAYPYIYWSSVDGTNQAFVNVSGSTSDANIGINSGSFTDPDSGGTYRWRTFFGNDFFAAERITVKGADAVAGRLYLNKNLAQLHAGGGSLTLVDKAATVSAPTIRAAGVLRADNISIGTSTITPVPNKPTSVTLTGGTIKGTNHRAFVTPVTSAPGDKVLGVGVTGVSSSGLTIWLHRTNNTKTLVNWMIMGED
ncbi:hypothetical protein [Streptomyces sp. NBC_01304]|uniref:hypothetical protein n=1 Tax=Streptomyces sp. NBC_01304 TaxID=2903818 RepID=UPI002E105AF9|nr:hypothetical protein OG430_33125 [Streptomyces sp. NBC_01304]